MSMFKSPTDVSSSGSESSSNESDHEVVPAANHPPANEPQIKGKGARTPPIMAGVNHGSSSKDLKDSLDRDTEGHANMMTAALLEFYCLSRAADILNAQGGSHKRFTRDCPEVKYLGKKMYSYKSQFLSSHGVLADGVDKDELGTTRQYYRDNLDLLGATALEELNLEDGKLQNQSLGAGADMILAPRTSNALQVRSNEDYAGPPQRPGLPGPRFSDIARKLANNRNPGALQNFRLDLDSLPSRALPLSGSSPVSFPLFDPDPPTPHERMSRYAMEFSEIKILGRGSFGEVYQVKNHIDGQNYAVKKIPLSQRRLEQLQCGSENQLETIMKEIRTLARLEHTNVVRYYGAWVEKVHLSAYVPPNREESVDTESEKTNSNLLSHDTMDDQSYGVVFGHSESSASGPNTASYLGPESANSGPSQRRSSNATMTSRSSKRSTAQSYDDDDEEVESIPRNFSGPSHGQLSTFGGTDNDIFTDGLSHDQSKLQIQRRNTGGSQIPAVVLHIQMSLHPTSLGSYLSPEPSGKPGDNQAIARRHCFHLIPSIELMLRIMSGVEYLHSKGIVHRDLKPANIFLSYLEDGSPERCPPCQSVHEYHTRYCHPRIGDFGLVADISNFNERSPDGPVTSAQNGAKIHRVVGTEFYRPPFVDSEVEEPMGPGDHGTGSCYAIDETLDMYALGVILFELLYRLNTKMERQLVLSELTRPPQGQVPTEPSLPADFDEKVDLGHVELDDGVSVAEMLRKCIKGMLDPLPHQRWSCADVRKHLDRILIVSRKSSHSTSVGDIWRRGY